MAATTAPPSARAWGLRLPSACPTAVSFGTKAPGSGPAKCKPAKSLSWLAAMVTAIAQVKLTVTNGITANPEVCAHYVNFSIGTVTALNPVIGYERATELATEAAKSGRGILELVREKGILSEAQIAAVLDPRVMTGQADPV